MEETCSEAQKQKIKIQDYGNCEISRGASHAEQDENTLVKN